MSNPDPRAPDPRRGTNPLFGPNRLKLGLFGVNVSNGCAVTTAAERFGASWAETLAICETADRFGYEALVPVARWKGFGGETNFNGTNFDTYTWAAGIAQATKHACVLTTSHVPTVHPIMAAKQATTVDHIGNGRFALNIVCGWFAPELEMFGRDIMEHDIRYDYAAEWIEIMKLLWTREEEFDFEGKFLRVAKGFAMPKPIQKPFPPLMNAGSSGKGRDFAVKYADMAFIHLDPNDIDKTKAHIESYRRLAREEHGREIQIWGNAYVVQRATQKEADDYLRRYVIELGDDPAVENILTIQGQQMQRLLPEAREAIKFSIKAGWGGVPLVGTPDRIVAELLKFSRIGLDGILLSWVDYLGGLIAWQREVMPRLVAAGLRLPAA
ncbi:MAG TPA: LLM class flavin-dependent oxidoreductase [Stellaceae bacterium]|jgi:alkanesulfonate monooxygenase SsuD/methylene tetrahydromethanopterin reductase-like flavin-dependent oxidoreductase (luciferase family)